MKMYEKMKAVAVDLSKILDEVVSFDAYADNIGVKTGEKKLAFAGATDTGTLPVGRKLVRANYRDAKAEQEEIAFLEAEGASYDRGRFTRTTAS